MARNRAMVERTFGEAISNYIDLYQLGVETASMSAAGHLLKYGIKREIVEKFRTEISEYSSGDANTYKDSLINKYVYIIITGNLI